MQAAPSSSCVIETGKVGNVGNEDNEFAPTICRHPDGTVGIK